MITINQLNKKQDDYIRKLDTSGLRTYIDNIAKTYYLNVINNDKLSADNSIETLNRIKMLHSDKNIDTYINHSLVTVINEILITGSSENINAILPEPTPQTIQNGFMRKTKLDKIFDCKQTQKASEIEKEYKEKYTSDDDILKLYNYEKYHL